MTLARFEELIKGKHPNSKVFPHGDFLRNKINVTVCFDFVEGSEFNKVYHYNGTYCEVLNRLGVKAIYKHDLVALHNCLDRAKRTHGQEGWFGDIIDNTEEIARLEKEISDYESNYVVV